MTPENEFEMIRCLQRIAGALEDIKVVKKEAKQEVFEDIWKLPWVDKLNLYRHMRTLEDKHLH
jgi:hypothetical protein